MTLRLDSKTDVHADVDVNANADSSGELSNRNRYAVLYCGNCAASVSRIRYLNGPAVCVVE